MHRAIRHDNTGSQGYSSCYSKDTCFEVRHLPIPYDTEDREDTRMLTEELLFLRLTM